MSLFSRRAAAAALLSTVLFASGCSLAEEPLAVPTEEMAVELAKEDVEGYVELLMTVLNQDALDTSRLTPVVSETVLEQAIDLRQQRIDLRETVSGNIRVHSQTLESIDKIGGAWSVVLLACLDYTQIVRHREDGSTLPAAPGSSLPQRRIEVRIDTNTGSREVIAVQDTERKC